MTLAPIRLGIVGLGLIAQAVHLPNLRTLRDDFDVVHMCDLSPALADQLANEWGGRVRTSSEPESLFADPDVDAVLLLTPGTHAALAEQALRAGKHVLAEKPFSHTAAEAVRCAELAAAGGLVLQVGYMKMYEPILDRVRTELANLGEIRVVRVTVLHPADEPQFSHVRQVRHGDADPAAVAEAVADDERRLDRAVGQLAEPFRSIYRDVLQGSACHELSLLRGMFAQAPVTFTSAQIASAVVGRPLAEPPQIQALGRVGDAQLTWSWNWLPHYPEYDEEIAVFGTAGRLYLRMPPPYLLSGRAQLTVERMDGGERSVNRLVGEPRTGFESELRAFRRAVVAGGAVVSNAEGASRDCVALQELVRLLAQSHGAAHTVGGEAAAGEVRS